MSLDDVRKRYPRANYAPQPKCMRCSGTGEFSRNDRTYPCMCIFVAPEFLEIARETLAKTVAKLQWEATDGRHAD